MDPLGALERAPGPHPVRRFTRFAWSAFMDSKFLALTRRINTKFVPMGLYLLYIATYVFWVITQNFQLCKLTCS